jgi:molecular chaperone DnaK (HSP70)
VTDATLAIDLGTSNTVAALRRPDGRIEQVLFDGSPVLPSAVFAQDAGTLLVGRDALHAAGAAPERLEPNPKLRIDDGSVLLGAEVGVPELFAAVLRRVAEDADRSTPGDVGTVVLTHPAAWGTRRRQVLVHAAQRAGLPEPRLLAEPIAAAHRHRSDSAAGSAVPLIVYDLGGGTHDVSVVHADRVLASDGLPDTGGLDIDAAILAHLDATYRHRDPDAWTRLRQPASAADQRHQRQLLDQVRTAKELLSRSAQTFVHVPLLDLDAPLGREQLDAIAQPLIDRTVRATRAALATAGLEVPPRAALYLTGGASRMPLVASTLHRALRIPPIVTEQPEFAVAHGALLAVHAGAPHRRPAGRPAAARPTPVPGEASDRPTGAPAPQATAAPDSPVHPPPRTDGQDDGQDTRRDDAEGLSVPVGVLVLAGGLFLTFMLVYAADLAWWATILCCLFNLLSAGIVWIAAWALMLRFGRDEARSMRPAAVVAVGYYVVTTIALLVRAS